jgi:hypothetical protein
VIISLVRNAKKSDGSAAPSGSIGFLKSSNRTNVLLSRAKHGMFLIGNASLMEKEGNGIWPEVIAKLRQSNRVGEGFPVACMNHPEAANIVTTPEMLREVAPDGGCDRPCGYNLPCGHVCPRKCKLKLWAADKWTVHPGMIFFKVLSYWILSLLVIRPSCRSRTQAFQMSSTMYASSFGLRSRLSKDVRGAMWRLHGGCGYH